MNSIMSHHVQLSFNNEFFLDLISLNLSCQRQSCGEKEASQQKKV